ncbi:hypothetical protein HK101_008593 [Irineochytrium annulatum]|nr:hypothetical protein HK101_008593 [Irineochytrium annulatum]
MSSIPTTQKALIANEKFKLDRQIVQDWPVPTIGDTEVLVRVEAAALNPVDWKIIKYGIFVDGSAYPASVGSDGAGRVVAVGSKVRLVKVGARVFFQGRIGDSRTSSFQQYAAIAQENVHEIADSVSLDAVVTLPVAAAATAVALGQVGVTVDANVAGKHILIWGATSSVGHIAVQVASKLGLEVIATASPKNHAAVKTLGASHVIDYRAADAVAQIRAIAGDDLIYAIDTVGAPSSIMCIQSLSNTKRAKVASVAAQVPELQEALKGHENKSAEGVFGSVDAYPQFVRPVLERLVKWVNAGEVRTMETRVLGGLEAVAAGQADQIAGKVSNVKLIVHP